MTLSHESIYTLDTDLSLLEVFGNINLIPSFAELDYKEDTYFLSFRPFDLDQEDIEEFCELISTKMDNGKVFGEIYDLRYDEECLLQVIFGN